jgi:hypothetical protein
MSLHDGCGGLCNSRDLELRTSAIDGAHLLGIHDRLQDATHVALEIQRPLIERRHRHCHFATHLPVLSPLELLQLLRCKCTIQEGKVSLRKQSFSCMKIFIEITEHRGLVGGNFVVYA